MSPHVSRSLRRFVLSGVALVLVLGAAFAVMALTEPPTPAPARAEAPRLHSDESQGPTRAGAGRSKAPFDTGAHSTTDPTSIWVVVNKTHPITPSEFRPEISIVRGYQVATTAVGPLAQLLDASDRAGLGFKIASAFRSYDYQRHVHDAQVASDGQTAADRISARPGYSEHQTGLAVDLITPAEPSCDFDQCFATTPGGRWLREHAWEYGFLIRYTTGNESVTGYEPEPWHLRFVGRALASAMRTAGITTLEQFLGVPGGGYPN